MNTTLTVSGFRFLSRQPTQLLLSLLGIALGVAAVISIDLANGSARRAFELSAATVFGRTTHQIQAVTGLVPETVFLRLRRAGFTRVAPIVEGDVFVTRSPGRSFTLLGVDPLNESPFRSFSAGRGVPIARLMTEPGSVLLSAGAAASLNVGVQQSFSIEVEGKQAAVTVIGVLPDAPGVDQIMLADISTALELLGRRRGLNRIDLVLDEDEERRVAGMLEGGLRLQKAGARQSHALQMTRAFELNLTMLSLLGLVVGGFLVFNTMTFSVIRRRVWIGVVRALGVTRGEIFASIIAESLALGLAGALLGIGLGIWIAKTLVRLVSRTINDLYFTVNVTQISYTAEDIAKGAAFGLLAVVAASLIPALEATRVPPRAAQMRSQLEQSVSAVTPVLAGLGLLVWALGGLVLWQSGAALSAGFGALFALLGGAALVIPLAVRYMAARLAAPMHLLFGHLGATAVRGIGAGLSRSAVAVIALTIAVSAVVGVGVMVDSFRASVDRWLQVTLRADIYVSTPGAGRRSPLAPELIRALQALPEIMDVSQGMGITIDTDRGPLELIGIRMARESYSGFEIVDGDSASTWAAFDAGALLVSEPYAYRYGLKRGDRFDLPTRAGGKSFDVAGVYRDYGSEHGAIVMARATLDRYWQVKGVATAGLYLADGVDSEKTLTIVRDLVGQYPRIAVRSNEAIRQASLEVFDRTFTITEVLRVLAAIIAFVGTLNAIMALQLERRRELGLLRAYGLTRRQGFGLIVGQSGLIGAMAGLFALPLGLAMAWMLIHVINLRSFGWTMATHLDPWLLAQAFALATVSALLAGLWPAYRINRMSPATALRTE